MGHKKLSEREQYWQATVERLLAEAQQTDQQEDQRFGKGKSADSLPEELAHAKSRLERIRQAKAALEQEAQEQLKAVSDGHTPRKRGRPRKEDQTGQPRQSAQQRDQQKKRVRRAKKNAEQPTRQYNFVDPDSRVMKDNARKCFVQAYNAQIGVDGEAQVIVAAELTQQTNDREQLLPMVQSVRTTTQSTPAVRHGGCGLLGHHQSEQSFSGRHSGSGVPGLQTATTWRAPQNEDALRMRELLATETGKALYATRKATVEPVFGQIKEGRGIRRFRLRGLTRAGCEWKLICATHNLLKLFRHRAALASA